MPIVPGSGANFGRKGGPGVSEWKLMGFRGLRASRTIAGNLNAIAVDFSVDEARRHWSRPAKKIESVGENYN